MKSHVKIPLIFIALLFNLSFCKDITPEIQLESPPSAKAKYIFLFIGDGMGQAHIDIAEAYQKSQKGSSLSFTGFPYQCKTTTYNEQGYITDSAAAATALATGQKTYNGLISQNINGKNLKTIVEILADKGMKTGIISSVSMDHSTPGAFYAHSVSRYNYYQIAMQAATSPVDYFGGGPFLDSYVPSDQLNPKEAMVDAGWIVSEDPFRIHFQGDIRSKLYTYQPNRNNEKDSLPYCIDATTEDVSMADFTEIGIKRLKNPKGFFMMIEGGKIDWASHANDIATMVHEVIGFSKAVEKAIDFYNEYPDETLIIVTADHETGDLEYDPHAGTIEAIAGQKLSFQMIDTFLVNWLLSFYPISAEQIEALFGIYFGLRDISPEEFGLLNQGLDSQLSLGYSYYKQTSQGEFSSAVTSIIAARSGVFWNSHSHTSTPVSTYAIGNHAESFRGQNDNTDIFNHILSALE
ncbi:MAG: alkaline phosphatase [Spirochaetales bacterium]|nr:alkaline phosphatase [Spirochaetales bacterium]